MTRRPTHLDRIDACSGLAISERWRATINLYSELDQTDGVNAVTWRAMGIELGALAILCESDGAHSSAEILRSRSVDCHQRADTLRRIALIPECDLNTATTRTNQ